MLIETKDILCRFSENIEWASSVDLATAWATENDGLYKLKKTSDLEIRAIVGLWGNITDPKVLRILDSIGKLRIVDKSRFFHPKVYVFRNPKKSVAWVGSANFTRGGFKSNEELLFETSDTKAIENWFDRLWDQCGCLQDGAIDEYVKDREQNPPKVPQEPPSLPDRPLTLLQGVTDWNGYLNALKLCDRWWVSRTDHSVLGKSSSWYDTIYQLRPIVRQNWGEIEDDDGKRLLGLLRKEGADWGFLGRMRSLAYITIFQDEYTLNKIQDAVHGVVVADDNDFPGSAIEAYDKITDIKNLGPANATRLLALARPDRIVSINGGSRDGLAEYFKLNLKGDPLPSERYRSLLDRLYEKPWFNGPGPEAPCESNIWSMRAALMDCFVYRG